MGKNIILLFLLIMYVQAITPDSVSTIFGVENTGGLTNISILDGNYYNVSEENSAPSLYIRLEYYDISRYNIFCENYVEYDGTDTVNIQVYNGSSLNWDTVQSFTTTSGLESYNFTINSSFSVCNNTFRMRFYDPLSGNPTKDLNIDYVNCIFSGSIIYPDSTWTFTSYGDEFYYVRLCKIYGNCTDYPPNTPIPINSTFDYNIQIIPPTVTAKKIAFIDMPIVLFSFMFVFYVCVLAFLLYKVLIYAIEKGVLQ